MPATSAHFPASPGDCQSLLQSDNPADTIPMLRYYACTNQTDFVEAIQAKYRELHAKHQRELPVLQGIVSVYAVFMLFGMAGNGLVIYLVAAHRHMRTPRNLYIANLAVSDFILCTFTQPLNILRLFQRYRSWGLGLFMCRAVNTLTGVNVFVSTYAITAIALDRFQIIAYPGWSRQDSCSAVACIVCLWTVAAALASPLAWFTTLTHSPNPLTGAQVYCSEMTIDPAVKRWKVVYSAVVLLFQYLIPLAMVSAAYGSVCRRLNRKVQRRGASPKPTVFQRRRLYLEQRRGRRANLVLMVIAVVFAVSWLPLTVTNVSHDIADLGVTAFDNLSVFGGGSGRSGRAANRGIGDVSAGATATGGDVVGNMTIVGRFDNLQRVNSLQGSLASTVAYSFAPLLLILVSACLNPILYGFFNYNFQAEFQRLSDRLRGILGLGEGDGDDADGCEGGGGGCGGEGRIRCDAAGFEDDAAAAAAAGGIDGRQQRNSRRRSRRSRRHGHGPATGGLAGQNRTVPDSLLPDTCEDGDNCAARELAGVHREAFIADLVGLANIPLMVQTAGRDHLELRPMQPTVVGAQPALNGSELQG